MDNSVFQPLIILLSFSRLHTLGEYASLSHAIYCPQTRWIYVVPRGRYQTVADSQGRRDPLFIFFVCFFILFIFSPSIFVALSFACSIGRMWMWMYLQLSGNHYRVPGIPTQLSKHRTSDQWLDILQKITNRFLFQIDISSIYLLSYHLSIVSILTEIYIIPLSFFSYRVRYGSERTRRTVFDQN